MKNRTLRLALPLLLGIAFPAHAILLDCEINADRTYTCIEISDATARTETSPGRETYGPEYSGYVEEAKASCVYNEPRRRVAGKNTGAALRSEELKSARAKYEKCITDKARELWRRNNTGGRTNAPGE